MLSGCSFPITYLKCRQDLLFVFLFSYPPPDASYSDSRFLGDPPAKCCTESLSRDLLPCAHVLLPCAAPGAAPLHLRAAPNTAPAAPLSINSFQIWADSMCIMCFVTEYCIFAKADLLSHVCCISPLIILMKACHHFILLLSIKRTGQAFGWYKMVRSGLHYWNTLLTVGSCCFFE